MSLTPVTIQVESNTLAVGNGAAQFMTDLKSALKSGNTFVEAVSIASAALKDLAPVLGTLPAAEAEATADPVDEAMTIAVIGKAVYQAILS